MKVVSNSSCIIALAKIRMLNILKTLFGKVLITKEVYNEIYHPEKEGFDEIKKADFLEVKEISNEKLFNFLRELIDDGEASAIVLALEENADLVIIDDKDARKIAKKFDLNVIGTAGILLLAKKKGVIKELKQVLEELKEKGFYLDEKLIEQVLKKSENI